MKTTISQYILGIVLTLSLKGIIWGTEKLFPEIGWNIMTVAFIAIFVLQVTFYYLTTNFKVGLTILSFILNFIFWTLEQVGLEKIFHYTWLYQDSKIGVLLLAGFLWVTNKILLDKIFGFLTKKIRTQSSILDRQLIT